MIGALARYAGLVWAPLLWAANTELSLILPRLDCERHLTLTSLVALVATILAFGSALASHIGTQFTVSRLQVFLARLSAFTGLVFALALILQEAASLLLNACER